MTQTPSLAPAVPFCPVHDMDAVVRFYREVLGFSQVLAHGRSVTMGRDEARVILYQPDHHDPHTSQHMVVIGVRDVQGLWNDLSALDLPREGIPRLAGWADDAPPGRRAFGLVDPAGLLIWFSGSDG